MHSVGHRYNNRVLVNFCWVLFVFFVLFHFVWVLEQYFGLLLRLPLLALFLLCIFFAYLTESVLSNTVGSDCLSNKNETFNHRDGVIL